MAKKRWLKAAAVPASAVFMAAGLTAPAMASSHREAPLISQDPTADNTDLYMFRDSTDNTKVNIIANFIGLEDPNGGPNFTKFGDDVQYSIHLNNTGGVTDDIVYNFRFRTTVASTATFLYNTGQVTSQADPDLNVKQTYSVERVDATGSHIVATNVAVPPVNVGQRSTPNYEANLAAPAVTSFGAGNASKVFAGARQDPFFVDTGSVFDLLGLRPLNGAHVLPVNGTGAHPGVNGLAGKNVHTIALQLPISEVNRNGAVPTVVNSKDSVLGAYASTSRQRVKVLSLAGGAPRNAGRWVQVSRIGIPLVNEVLIPLARKDVFNSSAPKDDAQFFADVLDPEPAKLIPILYPGVTTPPGGFNSDGTIKRQDILAVLTGQGAGLSAPNALPPADLLRVNLATPVSTGGGINNLGVIAGDGQGFPNGRRLADDVTDVQLRLVAGGTVLNPTYNNFPNNALTDGVDADDAPFLGVFPYVGTPYAGYSQNASTGSPNTAGSAAP